jgi:hypothetical protein
MASEKKREANRRNAKLAPAPKTTLSKARSAMNMASLPKPIVIGDEDPRQFDILRAKLEGDFNPGST